MITHSDFAAGEMVIGSIIGYFIYLILYLIDIDGDQLRSKTKSLTRLLQFT